MAGVFFALEREGEMNRGDRAVFCFKGGLNCAQSVFSAFAPELGLGRGKAAMAATAFGGGMARMGETCGAVTGAFMAISLKHGNSRPRDTQMKERTYEIVREFVQKFKERSGSIVCRELLGCDISTPEGRDRAKAEGLFDTVCTKLVRDSAEILEELLKG
jgi:C_GCAxxG_C_C family probable redox protein